jgi:hypothetical protein
MALDDLPGEDAVGMDIRQYLVMFAGVARPALIISCSASVL